MDMEKIEDIKIINLKENDILVLKYDFGDIPKSLIMKYANDISTDLKKLVPDLNVIVISNKTELGIIRYE